jgi:hypothetical protein
MTNPLVKFAADSVKIYGKTIFQVGTPPINYDTVVLEDDSGYMVQEISGQILLEEQPS